MGDYSNKPQLYQVSLPQRLPTSSSKQPATHYSNLDSVPYPEGYTPSQQQTATTKKIIASSSTSKVIPKLNVQPSYYKPRAPVLTHNGKRKTVVRAGGGQIWEDQTLLDWDKNDYRIFCGDLGNEVTDDMLAKAFNQYSSFVKAKVIRKANTKTRGYGFVSFSNPNDFVLAMKEVNGKYIGNRPVSLKKSNWEERNVDVKTLKKVQGKDGHIKKNVNYNKQPL